MTARTSKHRTKRLGPHLVCNFLAMLALASTSGLAFASTFSEQSVGPFYSRALVWDVKDLTEQNLRSLYRQLSLELTSRRAWKIEVFVDQDDATRELHGKLRTEETYDWWLKLYNEFGKHLLPKAEILSCDNNAVLRIRNSAGTCSEILLAGDNFLRVKEGPIDFELLETYFHRLPPHTKPRRGDEAMISVYVRASSFPSTKQATALARLMRQRFRQARIAVAIRTDSYFITDGAFPIVYRFDPDGSPPTRAQYDQSQHMLCFYRGGEVVCRTRTLMP